MFPRDLTAAYAELMEACKLPALANVAFYTVPQGGQKITGPSIRLAEEIARVYGNFEYGHRELSRVEASPTSFGRSEIEVYGWDKQTNNRSIRQLTVLHVLDTRDGPKKLRDQKDIDNKIANVASKQLRGRILAMMPKWVVESAIEECRKTLSGNNDEPISVRVRKMTQAFAKFGVTSEHLEKYLGHALDQTMADEIIDLTGVFNAIKDGASPSDFFGAEQEKETGENAAKESLASTAKQQASSTRKSKPPATKEQPAAESKKEAQLKKEDEPSDTAPEAEKVEQESKQDESENNPVESESGEQVAEQSSGTDQEPDDYF